MASFLLRRLNIIINNSKFSFIQIANMGVETKLYKPRNFLELEKAANNLKCGKKYAVEKLEELLGIRKFTALDIVLKNKQLWLVPGKVMDENYEICKKYELKHLTFFKYPCVLAQENLEKKLTLLKELPFDLDATAPLSMLNLDDLVRLVHRERKTCDLKLRVDTMTKYLETAPDVVFEAFSKRPFLRNINLERFEQNVKILKDNGITTDAIIKDWWVLQYNPNTIEERIAFSRENNIDNIKTWMIRAQVDIFENYVKRRSENKEILGDNTLVEYLSERLQCTPIEAKGLMSKLPALKHKSMKKMQEIIDFLYAEGFKPMHICRVPRILLHSVQTSRKRIRELEKQGLKIESLHMLTYSKKQYLQYYEALVKSNKGKIKTVANS